VRISGSGDLKTRTAALSFGIGRSSEISFENSPPYGPLVGRLALAAPLKMSSKILFSSYSYVEQLCHMLLEIAPPFLRDLVFLLAFKRFGRNSNVDYGTYFRYPWRISIGRDTWINRGTRIIASAHVASAEIVIGNNVAIGPGVTILSASHDYTTIRLHDTGGAVHIGDYAWIGAGAVILPNVTIGEGAVVGAGAVVARDVPPWTIAVGIPARPVKDRVVTNPEG
jgi:acetyltransferase-like isoleucine patch superfamily enzyme